MLSIKEGDGGKKIVNKGWHERGDRDDTRVLS